MQYSVFFLQSTASLVTLQAENLEEAETERERCPRFTIIFEIFHHYSQSISITENVWTVSVSSVILALTARLSVQRAQINPVNLKKPIKDFPQREPLFQINRDTDHWCSSP